MEISESVNGAPSGGIHDLYVELADGNDVEVDWIGFDAMPLTEGAFQTGAYRNLFAEMGYDPKEIDRRLDDIFNEPILWQEPNIF